MSRCLQLAELSIGNVAPNPMVGAVLVYEDKIIGEGYHQKYGGPHAEVNCINNVKEENNFLIEKATLYVSLEPCSHYGKTPPCADLIIKNKIKKVVIGCKDVYKEVAGSGIQKLQNAGAEVITGVLEKDCIQLNIRFFTFHLKFRPYIILKWAQTANGKIGYAEKRILISNEYSNRLVHKWRSEEAAILAGTNTALLDDPLLTTRLWKGKNAVRIVIDKELKLPSTLKIFNTDVKTFIYNLVKNSTEENLVYIKLDKENFIGQILQSLFEMNIQSVMIEGGARTLQSFINEGLWDEARVITNESVTIENGIAAPEMKNFNLQKRERYFDDVISYYKNND
ncbi:bifunctional diaminohydroxyphosphoribosylaminopyrimidine deaminase/5-amino-6-(5-phosphoribosylamino)uracil reductase RibD [Ginsengibacter hankyongi]|uniref:Riboflavin biosynthesis protein RibD n=2 Tax=Ginsengibacter hankyongi TaxID=2607284 RepID=A0A5J5IQF5_9BACT|nr:bifunctional diaminohydroxyphosphoribosylaminopyrimidine deaminase/5-amino-6-(5-phosphoribosylamino)uracil reductase RibD [Ginsengibacter hankyongi]